VSELGGSGGRFKQYAIAKPERADPDRPATVVAHAVARSARTTPLVAPHNVSARWRVPLFAALGSRDAVRVQFSGDLRPTRPVPVPGEDAFSNFDGRIGLRVDTWGEPDEPTHRVSGYRDGVSLELICWSREHAQEEIEKRLAGDVPSTADALMHGGCSARPACSRRGERGSVSIHLSWQESRSRRQHCAGRLRPRRSPGAHPPGDRLALTESPVGAAARVLTIV
jgi:hypothetical protein